MANRNYTSSGKIYTMHTMPVILDCNFIVDDTNANGITSLKGPTISSVLMHSAHATPTQSIAAGTIQVRLQDNFNSVLMCDSSIQSPLTGSDVKIDNSAMTAGVAYTITTLGNATAAKWRTIGVPAGVTAAVGVAFIAATNGGAGNTLTSRVQATATAGSGVATIEMVKDPNQSIAPNRLTGQTYGAQILFQCRDYAGALVAPVAGSKIAIRIYLSNSTVTVQGG